MCFCIKRHNFLRTTFFTPLFFKNTHVAASSLEACARHEGTRHQTSTWLPAHVTTPHSMKPVLWLQRLCWRNLFSSALNQGGRQEERKQDAPTGSCRITLLLSASTVSTVLQAASCRHGPDSCADCHFQLTAKGSTKRMRVLFRRVTTYSAPPPKGAYPAGAHTTTVLTATVCQRSCAAELKAYCERRKVGECRVMCEAADGARAACLVWEVGTVQPAPPNMSQIISPPTRVPLRTACPPSSHHAASEQETETGSVFPPPWSQLVIRCASMTVFWKIRAIFIKFQQSRIAILYVFFYWTV